MIYVFGARLVQISVVSAHSSFVVGLFYHNNVGETSRKPNLSNEVCMEELVDFFFYGFTPFFSHLSFLL